MSDATGTGAYLTVSNSSVSGTRISVAVGSGPAPAHRGARRSKRVIQGAVYAHIRAVRALGRTRLNTAEIAEALSLSIGEVNRAVASLKTKGVRLVHA